jgi:hypothetical protein
VDDVGLFASLLVEKEKDKTVASDEFASRRFFTKVKDKFYEEFVAIGKPRKVDNYHEIQVTFSTIKKYNAVIRGSDSLNSVECAISYIESIQKNSKDPEIFWDKE